MTRQLILGSCSPFRKMLLERLHLDFKTFSPDIDETPLKDELPGELAIRLGLEKAKAVAQKFPDALIIAGDQVAVCDEDILGKPGDHENALRQLQQVSGQRVDFLTSLYLYDSSNGDYQFELVPYHVFFKNLSNETIENYLKKEPAYNCAASFKSEGYGIALTERMDGSDPTALIGLPLITLSRMLEQAGIRVV